MPWLWRPTAANPSECGQQISSRLRALAIACRIPVPIPYSPGHPGCSPGIGHRTIPLPSQAGDTVASPDRRGRRPAPAGNQTPRRPPERRTAGVYSRISARFPGSAALSARWCLRNLFAAFRSAEKEKFPRSTGAETILNSSAESLYLQMNTADPLKPPRGADE